MESDIRAAMHKLPKSSLDDLYEEDFLSFKRSGQHSESYALEVFSMLLSAREPLSPKAIIQALATTARGEDETMTTNKLIYICHNLVVEDRELDILRFSHISFQEFLETRAELAPGIANSVVATKCLNVCLNGFSPDLEAESDRSLKDDFYQYSAVYWAYHCHLAGTDTVNKTMKRLEEFIFDGDDINLSFLDWLDVASKFARCLPNDHLLKKKLDSARNSQGSPLFAACFFGLGIIIERLTQSTLYDWNQENDLGQSGLYLAAVAGHQPIVESLLRHQANVNIEGGRFGYPLHAACYNGHTGIMKMLMEHGADPSLGSKNALEYAVLAGQQKSALQLLNGNLSISTQEEYDRIVLQAAEAGYADVIQLLQDKYAFSIGRTGWLQDRAVNFALFKGRTNVIERHLQRLGDPKTDMPKGAISTAALGGQDIMVRLLLKIGLNLDEEGTFGTPLRAASIMCHESTVKFLLEVGATPRTSGALGPPLHAAAMQGHSKIIQSLLDHGAEVNYCGGLYGTALQAAAYRGHPRAVELLLDAGADVYTAGFSPDALHAASESGNEDIVRLLLERGYEGTRTRFGVVQAAPYPNEYIDLLRDATLDHHRAKNSVRDLAQTRSLQDKISFINNTIRGIEIPEEVPNLPYRNGQDRFEDRYAIRAAAANGHRGVVQLLLSQRDQIHVPDTEIVAALREACQNGHEEVVGLLLSYHVAIRDVIAGLEAAANKGHLKVVTVILDHLNPQNSSQRRTSLKERFDLECSEQSDDSIQSLSRRVPITAVPLNRNFWSSRPEQEHNLYTKLASVIMNAASGAGHLSILRKGQELVT